MENNLKQLRKDKDMSLRELGFVCGVSQSCIHTLENGKRLPTLGTAYAIAAILDTTVYKIWPDTTKIILETTVVAVRRVNNE